MLESNEPIDPQDCFEMQWHSGCFTIVPGPNVEAMRWDWMETAAAIILEPLKAKSVPMVIFDLHQVAYFGSVFLAFLLRCHKLVKSRGGDMVLCGVSSVVRELLRITALDTLWAIYDSREEAIEALAV